MNAENIDFAALVANLEAKRAALDSAIVSLKAAIAAGALGSIGSFDLSGVSLPASSSFGGSGAEIPDGSFLGKTVSEAIKLYLSITKKKQTTRQIVEALKRGGIESKSDKFGNIVYNNLTRMQKVTGEIAKVNKEWGLAEWYHPGIRTPAPAQSGRRRGRPPKQKSDPKPSQKRADQGLPSRIETLLESIPGSSYSPTTIANALKVKPLAVNVRLRRMLARGQIVKSGPGLYSAAKMSVVKMPVAG